MNDCAHVVESSRAASLRVEQLLIISSLQLLLQTRREYCHSLRIAYVDLKAAFDSVNREALWLLLLSLGLLPKLDDLSKALSTDAVSCIRADGCDLDQFLIGSGVHQGCMVARDLFLTPVDWLLNCMHHRAFFGRTICTEPFTDLDFADGVVLLTKMLSLLILALEMMNHDANSLDLQVNWYKTKIQTTDSSFPRGSMCPWLVTMLKSLSPVHILVLTSITRSPLSTISGNALQ